MPQIVTNNYEDAGITFQDKILLFQGVRVCLLNDDRWRHQVADSPLVIDYAYVSKGYKGSLSELSGLFTIREVIVDSSLSPFYKERLLADCRKLQIPYKLLEEGCVQVSL